MQIRVHGEMTLAEIRHALFEKLNEIEEEFAVRYSRGATLFTNPTNGFGDTVTPLDRAGGELKKLNTRGPSGAPRSNTSRRGDGRRRRMLYETTLLHRPEAGPAGARRDGRCAHAAPDEAAADRDAHGHRKLRFFVDPIEGRLKIENGSLVRVYRERQIEAEKNVKNRH